MRYTTYHCGKAVIKDKNELSEAMQKLAKLEDAEELRTNFEETSKWIPCSEKMPEDDGLYNTTLSGELIGADEAFTGQSHFENGHWEDDGDCVIAWMPLPKPYREDKDE